MYDASYKKSDQARRARQRLRIEALEAYGGVCSCCGECRWQFLTIDHVHGGGNQHRRELREAGDEFYRWLKRSGFPRSGFRVLCFNCNCAIGAYGFCPHQADDPWAFPELET